MKKLFIVASDSGCVTHDGYIQLGAHNHSVERHLELCSTIEWEVTYWLPGIFKDRYPRVTFQKTTLKNEGSPPTDNSSDYAEARDTEVAIKLD